MSVVRKFGASEA